MKTSEHGIAILHFFEQCRLAAYPDPGTGGAPWTIGWGHTGPEVRPGLVWSQQQADDAFAARLATEFEPGVYAALRDECSQHQFDALVCLAYNIGVSALRTSTLLRKFNGGDVKGAAEQFLVWNRSGGRVMLGLKRRRAAERARFLGRSGTDAIAIGAAVES